MAAAEQDVVKVLCGKAKDVTFFKDHIEILFSDRITANNKEKADILPKKGYYNCEISKLLFNVLESFDVSTHMKQLVCVPEGEGIMCAKSLNMIPLEVIVRNLACGSFCKRYGIKNKTILAQPIVEFCVKDDDLGDPFISEDVAVALEYATKLQIRQVKYLALRVNEILKTYFTLRLLILVDFKLEFGVDGSSQIILADEISPDTIRVWSAVTGESHDKDVYRNSITFEPEKVIARYAEVLVRLKEDPVLENVHFNLTYPIVIFSGSESDNQIVEKVTFELKKYQFPFVSKVVSAHRNPEKLRKFVKQTQPDAKVYICIAGLSAALPGVVSAQVADLKIPVIAVPVASPPMNGMDALLSAVQMPPGVPNLVVGLNNGRNAAIAAIRILTV